MKVPVEIVVNGQKRRNEVEPRLLLVHYLRDVLGLTGTHVGCDTSQCGACTIELDGLAIKSCTIFTVQANGSDVTTIEGVTRSTEFLQSAFRRVHGLQCGFCTPGMIMSARQILARHSVPDETEVRRQLEGNLCRCTGYHNIIKAILLAADQMREQSPSSKEEE